MERNNLFFSKTNIVCCQILQLIDWPWCTKQPSSWRSLTCGWWREVEGTRRKKCWPKSGATKKPSTLNWSPSWTTSRRGRGWHSPCQSSPSSRLLPTTLPQVSAYFYLHFDSHFIWGLPMWFYLKLGFRAFFGISRKNWDFRQNIWISGARGHLKSPKKHPEIHKNARNPDFCVIPILEIPV